GAPDVGGVRGARARTGAVLARPGQGREALGAGRFAVPGAGELSRAGEPGVFVLQRGPPALDRAVAGDDQGEGGMRPHGDGLCERRLPRVEVGTGGGSCSRNRSSNSCRLEHDAACSSRRSSFVSSLIWLRPARRLSEVAPKRTVRTFAMYWAPLARW